MVLDRERWTANGIFSNFCSRLEKCVVGWFGEKHRNKPLIGVMHNRQDLLSNTGEVRHEGG
jgi:hypothetical protein